MKIGAIIQARMNSKRLPKKVFLSLCGKPVLEHIIERLKFSKLINQLVIATSNRLQDKPIVAFCKKKKIDYFTGSLINVLDRFYNASKVNKIDIVVRITADCPLIDPFIVDEVIKGFLDGDFDYYSLKGNFPDGLDCQVFKFSALEKTWLEASLPSDKEHVGTYIEKTNPKKFKIGGLTKFSSHKNFRWTLDQKQDYKLIKKIYAELYKEGRLFVTQDVFNLLKNKPELILINNQIIRNEGYIKSLKMDTR